MSSINPRKFSALVFLQYDTLQFSHSKIQLKQNRSFTLFSVPPNITFILLFSFLIHSDLSFISFRSIYLFICV